MAAAAAGRESEVPLVVLVAQLGAAAVWMRWAAGTDPSSSSVPWLCAQAPGNRTVGTQLQGPGWLSWHSQSNLLALLATRLGCRVTAQVMETNPTHLR